VLKKSVLVCKQSATFDEWRIVLYIRGDSSYTKMVVTCVEKNTGFWYKRFLVFFFCFVSKSFISFIFRFLFRCQIPTCWHNIVCFGHNKWLPVTTPLFSTIDRHNNSLSDSHCFRVNTGVLNYKVPLVRVLCSTEMVWLMSHYIDKRHDERRWNWRYCCWCCANSLSCRQRVNRQRNFQLYATSMLFHSRTINRSVMPCSLCLNAIRASGV